MRKVVGVLAGAAFVAVVGALWISTRRPSVAEQLAALRASGAWVPIEDRCRGHVTAPNDLTLWSRALAEAEARAPFDHPPVPAALDTHDLAPLLEVWREKDWALDPVSWTAEAQYLARRAAELAEVAEVFRSVGAYARLEACSVYAGLVPAEYELWSERMDPFEGLLALEFSLVHAASAGDREAVRRDLEALLTCAERLRSPVNAVHFFGWAFCVSHTLLALEGALPMLGENLDAEAWATRLAALRPRELLLESLELERAATLGSFESIVTNEGRSSRWQFMRAVFAPDPADELAAWSEGFELGRAYLRGEDGAEQRLERFQDEIDEHLPVSARLVRIFQNQEGVVCSIDARVALALTALRLARRGDARWEDVPREPDPSTGAALGVEELPGGVLRLSAACPDAYAEEQRASEWLVR